MKVIVKIYLISLAFQSTILFSNGSVEVNLPTAIGALITPFLLRNRRVLISAPFRVLLVMAMWLFLRTVFEYGIDTYIFSLFQLCTAVVPSLAVFELAKDDLYLDKLLRLLKWQLVLFVPMILRDYGLFDHDILRNLFGEIVHSTRSEFFGIRRSRASFYEPSYFGIYLCLLFVVFRYRRQSNLWLIILGAELLSTFSFGSFLLLAILLVTELTRNLSVRALFQIGIWASLTIVGIGVTSIGSRIGSVLSDRVQDSIEAIRFGVLTGSEGARINSLPVTLSFAMESAENFLFGEGYTYRHWLKAKYGSNTLNQLGEGHVFNTFAAVIFHGGMIGLAIYIIFIIKVLGSGRVGLAYGILFIYIHFTYSGLQSYFLWMVIFIASLFPKFSEDKQNTSLGGGIKSFAS